MQNREILSLDEWTAFNEEEEDPDYPMDTVHGLKTMDSMMSLKSFNGARGQRTGSHFPMDSLYTLSSDVKEQITLKDTQHQQPPHQQGYGMKVISEHDQSSPDKMRDVVMPRRNTIDRMIESQESQVAVLPICQQVIQMLSPDASPLPIMRNSSRFVTKKM